MSNMRPIKKLSSALSTQSWRKNMLKLQNSFQQNLANPTISLLMHKSDRSGQASSEDRSRDLGQIEGPGANMSVLRQMTVQRIYHPNLSSLVTIQNFAHQITESGGLSESGNKRRTVEAQEKLKELMDEARLEDEIFEALDSGGSGGRRNATHGHADKSDAMYDAFMTFLKKVRHRRRRKKLKISLNPFFKSTIRKIEGRFGSGVVSFFVFLRWIIEFNFVQAVMWMLFVIIPNLLPHEGSRVSHGRKLFENSSLILTAYNDSFYLRDLLDGGRWLSRSFLFFETYTYTVWNYPSGLVYFICIILTYFGGFVVILRGIAAAVQESGGTGPGAHIKFSHIIFCSWDYSILSKEASENLSKGICQSFKDIFTEMRVAEELQGRSKAEMVHIFGMRALAWTITLFLIITGSTTIFIFVTKLDIVTKMYNSMGIVITDDHVLATYTPTVIFVAINIIVPEIIYQLPVIEKYVKGKTEMYITITRVFFLRMINVVALLVSLYIKIINDKYTGCAGTLVGQELYKLVVLDTILQIGVIIGPYFGLYYWFMELQEFDMPVMVLKLLYRQALIWLAIMVCPLMPVIAILSMIVLFWTCVFTLMITCKPPSKRWNQPRRSTFFLGLTGATLGVIIVIISIVVASDAVPLYKVQGSDVPCGPFGNQTILWVFEDVRDSLKDDYPSLYTFLSLFTSATIILPLILVLIGWVYYQHLRIVYEQKKNEDLKNEVLQEQEVSRDLVNTLRMHGINPHHAPSVLEARSSVPVNTASYH